VRRGTSPSDDADVQDKDQAHGLAFSVKKGIKSPPSLKNIYKQLANEYPGFVAPTHG
jgi:uracil-DNA glycosylase